MKLRNGFNERENYEITIVNDYRSVSNQRRDSCMQSINNSNYQTKPAFILKTNLIKDGIATSLNKIDIKSASENGIENNPQLRTMNKNEVSKLKINTFFKKWVRNNAENPEIKLKNKITLDEVKFK